MTADTRGRLIEEFIRDLEDILKSFHEPREAEFLVWGSLERWRERLEEVRRCSAGRD